MYRLWREVAQKAPSVCRPLRYRHQSSLGGSLQQPRVAYRAKGDIDRAIADYTRALELNPMNADNNHGAAYRAQGAYDLSIADHTKAIQLDPNFGNAYTNRAASYFGTGKPAQGLPDAQESLTLRPGHVATLVVRGNNFRVSYRGSVNPTALAGMGSHMPGVD